MKNRPLRRVLETNPIAPLFVATVILSSFLLPASVFALIPPTLVDYNESNWGDVASTDTTGSVSWRAGDLIVVAGSSESGGIGAAQLNPPTATGLTFATTTSVGYGSNAVTFNAVWTATAGSSGSGAVTANVQGTNFMAGISVFVYRGSDGVGNSNTLSDSAATTISLTRNYANSAVIVAMGDWNAGNDTTVNPSPADGTQRVAARVASRATLFLFNWGDQGAAGTTSYGISNFSPAAAMSGVVVEIRGSAGRMIRLYGKTRVYNNKLRIFSRQQ